jgi:hypothetical protein
MVKTTLAGDPSRFHEFAHVGDGGDANLWIRTTVLVTNPSLWDAEVVVKFLDDLGSPMAVTIGGKTASSHSVTVIPDGMAKLTTAGEGNPLKVGWALLEADKAVGAQVFFEIFSQGKLTTQAAVETTGPMTSADLFVDVDMSKDQRTGVAIANLCDEANIEVSVVYLDEVGRPLRSAAFVLPPLGHLAQFMDELLQLTDGKGTLQINSTGPMTLSALQQTGLIIGTLPPMTRPIYARFGGQP